MSSPPPTSPVHASSSPPPQSSPVPTPNPAQTITTPATPTSTPPTTSQRHVSPIAHPIPTPTAAAPSRRAQKAAALEAKIAHLESELASVQAQHEKLEKELPEEKDPDKIVKAHIKRLHVYNETKDVAMGLIGLVAVNRGVGVGEVLEEFGVDGKD
ncbi:hypothetical protein BJ508DRAFT_413696 [Ascobolus immersus RN42]|uniref:Swi5-domain-containing protein n=1 Tax=Ascobolus immersus RN42 TaxID=1160509 RepID=A0A3N4IAC7_ASCIM|nr:hypothetical protein BJ508DRAFT_413696 [Ascobolus immersus RN42]